MNRRLAAAATGVLPALLIAIVLVAGCAQPAPEPASEPEQETVTEAETQPSGLPALAPISGTGPLNDSPGATRFTFFVFGDNQGGDTAKKVFGKIMGDLAASNAVLALSLGDVIKGKDPVDPSGVKAKLADYLALAKTGGKPIFNAPGNHEMDDENDCPNATMHSIYQGTVAPLYGAFDYGNSRFIALNTEDLGGLDPTCSGCPPSTAPAGMECSNLGATQVAQLDADLAANTGKDHIFIAMHYPVEPQRAQDGLNPDSVKALEAVLSKYANVSFVVASHEHLYFNPQDPSNVSTIPKFTKGDATYFLVSGGAGASIFVDKAQGGFHHYLAFDVNGDDVSVTIHEVDSS